MLEVGYKYGCLKVVSNDFAVNNHRIIESVKSIAEQEWLRSEDWKSTNWSWETNSNTFADYYGLNESEAQALDN